MPLFRDPDRRRHYLWSPDQDNREHPATGSPKSQLNEPNHRMFDAPTSAGTDADYMELSQSTELNLPPKSWANGREELIHRLKENSPWRHQHTSPDMVDDDVFMPHISRERFPTVKEHEEHEENPSGHGQKSTKTEELGSPADIQRPRSALHSGDFREGATDHLDQPTPQLLFPEHGPASPFPNLSSSPTTPWFGAPAFQPSLRRTSTLNDHTQSEVIKNARARAPSLGSFSSSYVLKAPTSPLVHQANNTDLDFSPRIGPVDARDPAERANRRRTLPPETFRNLKFSPPSNQVISLGSPSPPRRRQDIFTNQDSPPRRSLTSTYSLQLAPSSAGQIPPPRARRPSFASEISVKPHAPMVGSYEESILRGRMSMNPSKPLDFTAQIGVLGKGKCKGALKCPPHVTVPFPVVFYSYPTSGCGRSISDDNPSPYVGQIDLENSLPREDPNPTRRRRRHTSPPEAREGTTTDGTSGIRISDIETRRRREKKHRRAESPKCPPGGSYRIPQQGQLQIIIKNPHKTAVKLFLVPYDLSDMEPGTKTFIRQRSYSAGPIIDMPLSARKNYGTDRPEASLSTTEDPHDKPTLRYLIHLNICCPARGRFYLHSSIRVVFANRVPDGKEKLRNEIQYPEPRYSPYKPSREPCLSSTTNSNPRLAMELASRRQSLGHGPTPNYRPSPSGPEAGESLLAKRLRGLDVHTQNPALVDEQHPRKLGLYDRSSQMHDPRPR